MCVVITSHMFVIHQSFNKILVIQCQNLFPCFNILLCFSSFSECLAPERWRLQVSTSGICLTLPAFRRHTRCIPETHGQSRRWPATDRHDIRERHVVTEHCMVHSVMERLLQKHPNQQWRWGVAPSSKQKGKERQPPILLTHKASVQRDQSCSNACETSQRG